MENTLGKKPLDAPKSTTKRTLPPGRFAEQVEPVRAFPDRSAVSDTGRLQQSINVGKKPTIKAVDARNIEGLRPSDDAIVSDQD